MRVRLFRPLDRQSSNRRSAKELSGSDYHYQVTFYTEDLALESQYEPHLIEEIQTCLQQPRGMELVAISSPLSAGDILYVGDYYYRIQKDGYERLPVSDLTSALIKMAYAGEREAAGL